MRNLIIVIVLFSFIGCASDEPFQSGIDRDQIQRDSDKSFDDLKVEENRY